MINTQPPKEGDKKGTATIMAKVYTDLEFGDPIWIIRKGYVDNQLPDREGRLVTILEDGTAITEDEDDLVAILPALDE